MDHDIVIHNGTLGELVEWESISSRSIQQASDDYHQKIFGSSSGFAMQNGVTLTIKTD